MTPRDSGTGGWDELASIDPLWAVLSEPAKRGRRWEIDEFFAEGRREIDEVLTLARNHGKPETWNSALDYGCGPGRLTTALGARFATAIGVDASPEMIRLAEEHNDGSKTIEFHVVSSDGEAEIMMGPFDVVLSSKVLHHVASRRRANRILRRLADAVGPGGVLIVQLTTAIPLRHRLQPRPRLYELLRKLGASPEALDRRGFHPIRMQITKRSQVESTLGAAGLRELERVTSMSPAGVRSDVYVAARG